VVCATCWLINPIEHTLKLQIFCNTNNTKPDEEGKLKFSFVNLMAFHRALVLVDDLQTFLSYTQQPLLFRAVGDRTGAQSATHSTPPA
jgi:hypothetical protein